MVTPGAPRMIVRNLEAQVARADDRCRAAEIERAAARDALTEARRHYGVR